MSIDQNVHDCLLDPPVESDLMEKLGLFSHQD